MTVAGEEIRELWAKLRRLDQRDIEGKATVEYVPVSRATLELLLDILVAAEAVGDHWEAGDLAGAVQNLMSLVPEDAHEAATCR